MRVFFFITLFVLSAGAFAQRPADSLYLNPIALRQFGYQTGNLAGLASFKDSSTAAIEVGYGLTRGSFRKAQQPFMDQQARLGIEGINTFKRFRTWGRIKLTRNYQDSLAWSAKGTEDVEQPYYYGSIKPGPFQRTAYSLSGMLLYALVPGKLNIGSGIDYDFKTSTRSVDPRPEVNAFSLKLRPQVTYQHASHTWYAGGIWGYGDEQNILTFKSIQYRLSPAFPDRINYLIQGYGLIAIRQGNQEFHRRVRVYGGEAGYVYAGNRLEIMSSVRYEKRGETNMIRLERSTATADIGRFNTARLDVQGLFTYHNDKSTQQLELTASNTAASDFNVTKGGTNYYYDQTSAAAAYTLRFDKGATSFKPDFGISLAYSTTAHEDIISAHQVSFTRFEPGIRAGFLNRFSSGDQVRVDAGGRFSWSSDNRLSVPASQETVFSRGVIYPDFAYNTSEFAALDFNLSLVTARLVPGLRTGLAWSGTYLTKWKQLKHVAGAMTNPGSDRFFSNISINLYF
ncbi:hypothetical protein C7T94_11390 [Pedobacter yulinensis]|uniref:DUF6850 domain-containing protein n=1 Tax=Pedobacter yulinensis TaxID=2126353 RepID=A0A2T3HL71_9SPHI|nr:DUF6850 family outer membrane beta-barrel protein [Pedobacter yulinensis]PST83195.1 hypothetical protein C7T94_11390 [Pedobacter yulinensis]